jgi:hypothetical protein
MQSSAARKFAHTLPPLTEEAAPLAPKRPLGGSTPSTPDIATLLERFDEPLRGAAPSTPASPALASAARSLAEPSRREGNGAPQPPAPNPAVAPAPKRRSGLPRKALFSALAVFALVPLAILFVRLWPDMMRPHADGTSSTLPVANAAMKKTSPLEVALSSPAKIAAHAGDVVRFPIAIDATGALPARSIIAITAVPRGASFSEGRPYGVTGWSLRPDEIAGLQLRLPTRSGASDMRLELLAGDGTMLSQSETRVSIGSAPPQVATTDDPLSAGFVPLEQMATASAVESTPAAQAATEVTGAIADAPPAPLRRPSTAAGTESAPKVNTVKVVTIAPPHAAKPHDGGYGLGPATEAAQAPDEWMETKTAVDMHAKAEQSSETVKVAQGGLKVRVTGRDNRWVQVNDPKSSTTGWIYDRFLKPAEPPAN